MGPPIARPICHARSLEAILRQLPEFLLAISIRTDMLYFICHFRHVTIGCRGMLAATGARSWSSGSTLLSEAGWAAHKQVLPHIRPSHSRGGPPTRNVDGAGSIRTPATARMHHLHWLSLPESPQFLRGLTRAYPITLSRSCRSVMV